MSKRTWRFALLAAGTLGLFYVLIAVGNAQTRDLEVTWTAPTQRCDGSPLVDLAGYKLRWGVGQQTIASAATLAYTVPNVRPGLWWVSVSAYTASGQESEAITVTKEVLPETLKTIATGVYTVIKAQDRFVYLPVGTAPVGTSCDATQPVGKYHVIRRGGVTWTGTTRPVVVVADCG